MESGLSRYLREEASRPFALGQADCVTFIADWVRERRGGDPMAHCRGYAEKAEAEALLAGWGGLVRASGRAMRRYGFRMARQPAPGDVAIVRLGDLAVGAIRTRRRWALRLDTGFALLPLDSVRVIAAWRVGAGGPDLNRRPDAYKATALPG